jgi:pyrroloquinoline-quinone synthase
MYRNRKEVRPKTLLESLDALIKERHLLKHPFYQAWTEGTLSKESLQLYAEQYYHTVRAFPEILHRLAQRASMPLAAMVRENLAEETNPAAPLPLLWRQFAQSLGVSESAIEAARPLPGIAALLDTFDEVSTQGSMCEAVAAFYAYEAQVPEVAERKIACLQRFYDVSEPRALAYFTVQQETDARRRSAWRSWLITQPKIDEFGALCSADRTLKAIWGALDAVYPPAYATAAN